MPFGRTGRQNNRSQHALVEPTSGGSGSGAAGSPVVAPTSNLPAASPNTYSPNESFDSRPSQQQQQQQQQQQPAPLHHQQQQQQQHQAPLPPPQSQNPPSFSNEGSGVDDRDPQQLHSAGTTPPAFDARQQQQLHQQRAHDFADQVSRSQSQRYPQIPSLQGQQQYGPASSSYDDLATTLNANQQALNQGHPLPPPPVQQHQQYPVAAPESRRSTRKLIKNILSGSSGSKSGGGYSQQPPPPQNSYDNTSGLARRPSKRISTQQPPAIRTGPSQVSLEEHPGDWQVQGQHTQPSPLQGVGEYTDPYSITLSNEDLYLQNQNPQAAQHPSIRPVPGDVEGGVAYGPDDVGAAYRRPAPPQIQGRSSPSEQPQSPYSQGGSYDSTQHQYPFHTVQQQYQGGGQQVLNTHLGANPQHPNPETVSQLSHESPATDTDQQSTHKFPTGENPPPGTFGAPGQSQEHQTANPDNAHLQQQTMAPPPGGPGSRRPQEADKSMRGQVEPPVGPPPGYRHSQASNLNPNAPPPSAAGANPSYRHSTAQDRQYEGIQPEGRNSPQPPISNPDAQDPEKALKELVVKYKNVKRLYFDGKSQIEQLNGQVEQLQNAVANQRMSQSRTSLDDNEYSTRFNRLNGAINNLSFNIRKDWASLPPWLEPYVSAEALRTGKQEMTAVGRAVITRWVVEEIFNQSFHPGLDPELSRQLKDIEHNIRRFSYKMNSQEEFDALTTKIVGWRMATLEGLQPVLNSPESAEHRSDFIRKATTNLTAGLFQFLKDPPPPGVDGSASMIVELAVGLAANLPLESRDVAIVYPLPLDNIQPALMEVEKVGLPPLEMQNPESDDSGEEDGGKEAEKKGSGGKDRKSDKNRSGTSAKLIRRAGPPDASKRGQKGGSAPASQLVSTSSADTSTSPGLPPKDAGKVRFAGFVAVEVRGRQVLLKAPVWTLS
ncbi:uncharacterized protein E0L32_005538 [Thyridium curvatum]|uniref:S-adenosylmethionine-dependent methyltransferase-like protein n=1 Tax=Thyridium curvatum TaxID=1093900 RepID=A0A507AWK0_9PEZI|nr:uncharacterized protein E0L32_005538 [Thyridium curvatum]TPX14342.1 hypothetical protein E0L32_005538 [Thyridium curvatum]